MADLGAYCGFVDEDGQAMSWLQRVDSIAVNGVHGVVISAGFVRLQMLRVQRTYDLLVTRHSLANTEEGKRPRLESSILFYGRCGTLEMDLASKDAQFRGTVSPVFYSRGGESASLPAQFQDAVVRITTAASRVGCRHCHLLQLGTLQRTVWCLSGRSRPRSGMAEQLEVDQVPSDPAASFWLKDAFRSALARDPVDAANDAEVLFRLLDERCHKILSQG